MRTAVLYDFVAELTNSVASKVLIPLGPKLQWPRALAAGAAALRQKSLKVRPSLIYARAGDEASPSAAEEEEVEQRCYPGDTKLMGQSDFSSPLFVMLEGVALYAWSVFAGLATSSVFALRCGAIFLLVSHGAACYVSAHRGQTLYGFLAGTFLLQGLVLLPSAASAAIGPALAAVLLCQGVWVATSGRALFPALAALTTLHMGALVVWIVAVACSEAGCASDTPAIRYVAAALFALLACCDLALMTVVLGCEYHAWCRKWIFVAKAGEAKFAYPLGYASDRLQFDKCVRILRSGGVCCIPTDTVYCLACGANQPEAIKQRIYAAKQRPAEKPLSLWLGDIQDIKAKDPEGKGWCPLLFSFMDAVWPGSVSLVVSRGAYLDRLGMGDAVDLIGTADSIALRVPNSTLTISLLKEAGPLAITSANPSGACDCTHHNKVDAVIASKIGFILADGPSPMTIASSVIDVREIETGPLFFYRVGCVPEEYVWRKLNEVTQHTAEVELLDLSEHDLSTLWSQMTLLSRFLNIDSWNLFYLKGEQNKQGSAKSFVSARQTPGFDHAVCWCFETGCVHIFDQALHVPVFQKGGVIAVLQLLNKRDAQGNLLSFSAAGNDVSAASIVTTHLTREAKTIGTTTSFEKTWVETISESQTFVGVSSLLSAKRAATKWKSHRSKGSQ